MSMLTQNKRLLQNSLPEAATFFSGDPRVGVAPPPPETETRRDKDKEASLDLVLYFFGEISSDEEDMSTSSSKNGEVSWSSIINCVEFLGAQRPGPLVGLNTNCLDASAFVGLRWGSPLRPPPGLVLLPDPKVRCCWPSPPLDWCWGEVRDDAHGVPPGVRSRGGLWRRPRLLARRCCRRRWKSWWSRLLKLKKNYRIIKKFHFWKKILFCF